MRIFYHISWRRSSGAGGNCDSSTISSGTLLGQGDLNCQYGCSGTISPMSYYCTDYSTEEDWSFGERQLTYNFTGLNANVITIGFTGAAWISPFNSRWNISTTFSIIPREDTGRINSSPRAITSPVLRLQQGCNHTITLAVTDPDNDIIRCRWAVGRECGGICNRFPGAVLDSDSCTITYEATRGTGYNAAALMIEDFIPGSQHPLSSVALQFLVFVVASDESCSLQPEFIDPTLPSGLCLAIPPSATFSTRLVATSHSASISIVEIQTVSPRGTNRGELQQIQDTNSYYVNITWTPTTDQQNETHLFCFTAVNSEGLASEQSCLEFLAGQDPPTPHRFSSRLKVHPSDTILSIRFDKNIQRPVKIAFIRLYNFISDEEVYKIDVSLSQEVVFNNSTEITILPNYVFTERNTYYLSFDRGIVHGIEGCGPVNDPVVNKTLWSFEVMDVTPPVITFVENPIISNGTIRLYWNANENVTWVCMLVTGHGSESIVNCSQGTWTGYNLTEGSHELTINATDDVGNVAVYIHTFQVDLTAPEVTIIQRPQEISNQKSFTIRFTCNELCSFQCQFYTVTPNKMDNYTTSCNNGVFSTPTLDHNATNTIIIIATDQVGNRGDPVTYVWETDFVSPQIFGVSNLSVVCTNTIPDYTGRAQAIDDRSAFPSVTYSDVQLGCSLERTWTAMDEAGNIAHYVQYIGLEYVPTLSLVPQISFSCDSTLDSIQVPTDTATSPNPCGLPQTLSYEDSISVKVCPSEFVRNWTITVCNVTVSRLQNITVFDLCPPYACGRNESVPRGICSFGECQCNTPWYGEDCSVLIYEPVLGPVNNSVLHEAQQYVISLVLLQGTSPLSWTLINGPNRLDVDQYTGQVNWARAEAGNHSVSVRVENQVGYTEVTWTLQVLPGYSAILNQVFPTLYPYAMPIVLTGNVEYVEDNLVREFLAGIVPISIDIVSNGVTRTLRTFSTTDDNFSVVFYPAIREYGSYQAGARHPSVPEATIETSWGILGLIATTNPVYLSGEAINHFDRTYHNATAVCNDGPAALSGIKVTASFRQSDILQIEVLRNGLIPKNVLEPGEKLFLDIAIMATQPLRGSFAILVESAEGTSLQIVVSFQIEPILPTFLIQPPSINSRIIRGRSRVFEFNITNTGRTVANEIQPLLPNTEVLSFISFGNGSSLDLSRGESAVLSILIQTPVDQQLGDISASIAIISTQISTTIPIRLTVSSNVLMNLTIVIEDEFTYFASGQPLVDNAVITLINNQRNIRITMTTERDNGSATFFDIYEDRYEVFIEAPDHLSVSQIIVTSLDNPTLVIFMQRETVTYTWNVTPVEFQDTYVLTIEADFVTHVPVPVVTVTPREFDLEELELGFISTIQLNITNHGLIRANGTTIELPTDHPFLEFSVPSSELGYLDPLSSIIVTVNISRKSVQKRIAPAAVYAANILYNYICGDLIEKIVSVIFKKEVLIEPRATRRRPVTLISNVYIDGCSSCAGGFSFSGYSSITNALCNPCLQTVIGCLPLLRRMSRGASRPMSRGADRPSPMFPSVGCLPDALQVAESSTIPNLVINFLRWVQCEIPNPVLMAFLCGYDLGENCINPLLNQLINKRDVQSIVQDVVEPMLAITESIDAATEVLGDIGWLSVGDENWVTHIVQPTLDDSSEAGVLISTRELSAILAVPPPNGTTIEMVTRLIERLNNTMHGWGSGQLEPPEGFNMASYSKLQELTQNINIRNDEAIAKGFSSYLDAYNFASAEFNKIDDLEEEAGVCAVVRIRIEQELAVTRVAFLAKLEIENMDSSLLTQGSLEIIIVHSGTGVQSTHLFAISNETLSGSLTTDNEGWSLPSEASGTVEWLIIPYSEAAPQSDRTYDIGGILRYSLDNENITIRLLPAFITVTPDPSLLVHYFWEKFVIGDDPFTDEVENSVPFTLGVAVKNAGYGTASSLQITSGQPEIIENEKGLLINFNIIGAFIGNEMFSPSLTVMFGDLAPNTTVVARWQMISSLQGEFRNYSATFENINPLGDPNLSILDELEIHELIRNIRIYGTSEDDEVLDFLVNEVNDAFTYPDMLYSSKSLEHYNVSTGVVLSVRSLTTHVLEVRTVSNSTGWVYYRYEDNQDILSSIAFTLNGTKQVGDKIVSIPPENSWITKDDSSTLNDDVYYLHIVDNVTVTDEIVFNMELCSTDCPTVEMAYLRAPTGM